MTLDLLQILESDPVFPRMLTEEYAEELYRYSLKNRMKTNFIEKLVDLGNSEKLKEALRTEHSSYVEMLDAVGRISETLSEGKIKYAIFKTIRPYVSSTVDIDVVIFGNRDDFFHACRAMRGEKYRMLAAGPMSVTFWDTSAKIGVDLYYEIAVSGLCYLDKDVLSRFTKSIVLPNGKRATLLAPEADLLAIVAHSIIKEQMYTLSECYSFLRYLNGIDTELFSSLARETNLTNAAKTHASLTALLFREVHRKSSRKLEDIVESIGHDDFETSRMVKHNFETPHKYHLITVGKSLLEIAKTKKSRSSLAFQIDRMRNPAFANKFLRVMIQHVVRDTY